MKTIRLWTAICLLALCGMAHAQRPTGMQGIDLETYIFSIKGKDTLRLDVMTDPTTASYGKRPIFLYVHGGGFEFGERGESNLLPYFARQGYVAVTIDYRLMFPRYRKTGKFEDKSIIKYILEDQLDNEYVWEATVNTIRIAVEDLYDATTFIVENATRWNADPDKFITCGGSAGAMTVLQAEHMLCNDDVVAKKHLPAGFRYACVIPHAGGIWTYGKSDAPEWKHKPCPIMMFHGTKDELLPYETILLPKTGGVRYGVKNIARQLREMQVPYALFTSEGADHIMAGSPIVFNKEDMLSFIKRTVMWKEMIGLDIVEHGLDQVHDAKYVIQKMKDVK